MARSERSLCAAIAALLLAAPLSAQQAPASVTLDQALKLAEDVTPSVVSARGSVRTAELSVRSAIWQFIPSITVSPTAALTLSSGQSRLDPVTGDVISGNTTNPSYGIGLNGSLTLFDGFARSHNLTAARAGLDAADASLTSQRFASALTVTNAFFDALQDQQLLRVSEGAVAQAEAQLKIASAKLAAGSGQRTDSLNSLVSLSQARQGLLTAQANLATAEANLGRYIGVEGRVAAADDSGFYQPPVLLDTTALRVEVMNSAPAIRSAQANVTSARANYRASKSAYWPTISLSANSSWTAQKSNDYTLQGRRQLNLGLNFSPWTSLQRETQVEQRSIQVDNAEATLADQQRSLAATLTQYFASLANAREQVNVSRQAVEAAMENVRVTNAKYQVGVATILEVVTAQQSLTQSQVSEVQARFSYLRTKAQLEALVGRKL